MVKLLDGPAFNAYCRQLAINQEVLEMIARIRASKPSGDLYDVKGSTCVGYPSKKMGDIIRAESCGVEFLRSILELEYSSENEELNSYGRDSNIRALLEEGDIQ
jgi:hypothetical protein